MFSSVGGMYRDFHMSILFLKWALMMIKVDLPFKYPMPICSTSPHLALSLGNILHFLGSSFVFSHFVLFLTRFS